MELEEFNFENAPVRVVTINGVPWFAGRDVAEVLGYKIPTKAATAAVSAHTRLK